MPNRNVITLLALLVVLTALWPMSAYLRYASRAAPVAPAPAPPAVAPDPTDPPEVAIGERLFREPRFAQFFAAHSGGVVNAPLAQGDPVLSRTMTAKGSPLPGTFASGSMSCRACHLVDEHASPARVGSRSYSDFARQSPIPDRDDGLLVTTRNSPSAVDVALPRANLLLHDDGEFASAEDLVRETILGRNFGWLAGERAAALRQVGRVIRDDDGSGALGRAFGGPYRAVFAGALSVPPALRLPAQDRLDVSRASDEQILDAVSRLVAAYLRSLAFHRDAAGQLDGSPYDRFLARNGLPRAPDPGEPDSVYARRLRDRLERLEAPRFVMDGQEKFRLHDREFEFGPLELRGLLVFLAEPGHASRSGFAARGMGVGNCAACHAPPRFTDFGFHNTGASEAHYEAIHGMGTFRRLPIPDLATRNAEYDAWLPATARHPHAGGRYRSVPSRMRPGQADLGLWNVVGNPDMPAPQAAIRALLRRDGSGAEPAALLARAIGCFKTPSLRDLGHSAPYLHSGRADSLEQVMAHYVEFSARARAGTMRNPDPRLRGIVLGHADITALVAFLESLDEDYE